MRTTIHVVSRREFWRYALGVRQARRAWALRLGVGGADEAARIAASERLRQALSRRAADRQGARRARGGVRRQPERLDRPGPRAALRDLGAAASGPAGARGGLGRAARRDGGRRAGPPRAGPPARVRPGALARHRRLGRDPGRRRPTGRGRAGPRPLPRRGRSRAGRPARRAAPGSRHAGARSLPAALGRRAPDPRPAHRPPARGAPGDASSRPGNPFSVGTYLVDGRVAGAWSMRDGRVVLSPLEALSARDQRAVEREREALEAFHA